MKDRFEKYMRVALRLAKKGAGSVSPNPMVGCVIVKNKKRVGQGFHKYFGAAHAEIEAIKEAGPKAKGAFLFINLEPCNHFGKTPPCTDAIINAGIKKVIVSMLDPNPINNGKGIRKLQRNGIEVVTGVLSEEARQLNQPFIKYITKNEPYVCLKMAQSLDGKIATYSGNSKWISSQQARRLTHRLRREVDAVMVGAGTVIKDNPLLTSRFSSATTKKTKSQPIKIVVDSKLRIPVNSKVFSSNPSAKAIVATTKLAPRNKLRQLKEKGVQILIGKSENGFVDLKPLMRRLAKKGISYIMVEGGGELADSCLKEGVVDKILFFVAPKIIGGRDAKTAIEGEGVKNIKDALRIKGLKVRKVGCDFLFEGYV